MNVQQYPIPDLINYYIPPQPRTFTIIPYVEGNFRVFDYGQGGIMYNRSIRLFQTNPMDITIPANLIQTNSQSNLIKQQLRELIEIQVQIGIDNDINLILGTQEESPPVKIHPDEINHLPAILGGGRATFQVIRVNGVPHNLFGLERVFKSAPPSIYYDKTKYYQPDRQSLLYLKTGEEASCGFQYLYHTFHNKKGFKKLARDFTTIKYWATLNPPQYQSWLRHYQKEINIQELGLNIQNGIDLEMDSFETELFKVEVLDLDKREEWTKYELYNSLSVLDIIRWCMWAKINCYVIDFDGHYYMNYNHNQITKPHNDNKKTTGYSIVVKVKDNHAYFVEDSNVKKSVNMIYQKWISQDFNEIDTKKIDHKIEGGIEDLTGKEGGKHNKDIESNRYWIHPYHIVKEQATGYGIVNAMKEDNIDPFEIGWDKAYDELVKKQNNHYKLNPPPLPSELIDNSGKTFYLGTNSLNGLVSHIYHNYNTLPDRMNGSSGHKIDRINYGVNRIMSKSTLPMYSKNIPSEKLVDFIVDNYPELDITRMPTIKSISDAIFNKNYCGKYQGWWWDGGGSELLDSKIYSMFNSNTRRAFYDSEIKADNQVYKEKVERDVYSIDISKAYKTALKNYDLEFNIYDGISQFEKYRGDFNPNYFYLVKEIGSGYPLRNQKEGLVLYHGCFLRHLLDKGLVEIEYFIKPIKTLPHNYFKPFVIECEETEELTQSPLGGEGIEHKRLINSWIGGLKKPDKINHFRFNTTPSETSLTRAFYRGEIVSMLDENTKFKKEYRFEDKPLYLISHPSYQYNIQSGQPIRLAVVEKVNEMLLKIHHTTKSCLWFYYGVVPEMCLTRTDAIYYNTIVNWDEDTHKKFVDIVNSKITDFDIRFEKIISKDVWEFKEYKKQNPVIMKNNILEKEIDIDKRWSKNIGGTCIFRLVNSYGGAWIQGEGGVGKTEFLKNFGDILDKNRIRYRWRKAILKSQEDYKYFEKLEEWRDKNPCFCIKLAPTNKACNNIGGKTINKGLGIPVMNIDDEDKTPAYFDKICNKLSGDGFKKPCFDYVIIDEISMITGYYWSLLLSLKRRLPRLKFILCGDIERQLPPVGEEDRDFNGSYLIKELSAFVKINFIYNFRRGNSKDPLWDDWSLHPKRFKISTEECRTLRNLCYTNLKRKEVIEEIEDKIKSDLTPHKCLNVLDFYKEEEITYKHPVNKIDGQRRELVITTGTPLIACKSLKQEEIAKNQIMYVKTWDRDTITFSNNKSYDNQFIFETFYSAYCITIHKAQGDTYDDKYTIHEWSKLSRNNQFFRRMRNVAQGRSTDPVNNITYKN